jgi:hypothetical protein
VETLVLNIIAGIKNSVSDSDVIIEVMINMNVTFDGPDIFWCQMILFRSDALFTHLDCWMSSNKKCITIVLVVVINAK